MKPLAPMLAVAAEPFDSPDYLFEIKWDGVRGLALVQQQSWRLWGRGEAEYAERYPELDVLRQLPPETILDGELVRLRGGKADFSAVLRRHQLSGSRKIRWAAQHEPVTYIVFDLLQIEGHSLIRQPLRDRRRRLEELLSTATTGCLLFSQGVQQTGQSFFDHVVAHGHEGVMAKRLDSRYLPGKRAASWRKIKPRQQVVCVVIGYRSNRHGGINALLLAALKDGALRYVGEVGHGLTGPLQQRLAPLLDQYAGDQPIVPCPKTACWVQPEIYCQVKFFGWTEAGRLRFPCFQHLLSNPKPTMGT
jgi:DNA ligase D-like protein (predicted ligase)